MAKEKKMTPLEALNNREFMSKLAERRYMQEVSRQMVEDINASPTFKALHAALLEERKKAGE